MLDTDPAFALHRGGKIGTGITVPLRDKSDLSLAYTPGVARVCTAIAAQPGLADDYTWRGNSVAVVTDGTRVFTVRADAVHPGDAAAPDAAMLRAALEGSLSEALSQDVLGAYIAAVRTARGMTLNPDVAAAVEAQAR